MLTTVASSTTISWQVTMTASAMEEARDGAREARDTRLL